MKKLIEDWLLFAEQDIRAASVIVKEEHLTNVAAFHCQQAIEKYFKAFMLEHDKPLIKTHNLILLYGIIKEIKCFNINEDLLTIINSIYVADRYPGEIGLLPDGMPSDEQAHIFLDFAKEIGTKIKTELGNKL